MLKLLTNHITFEMAGAEVWNFLDYKMNCNVDVEVLHQCRHRLTESLLPTQNNRLTRYFPILIQMREQTLSVRVKNSLQRLFTYKRS